MLLGAMVNSITYNIGPTIETKGWFSHRTYYSRSKGKLVESGGRGQHQIPGQYLGVHHQLAPFCIQLNFQIELTWLPRWNCFSCKYPENHERSVVYT